MNVWYCHYCVHVLYIVHFPDITFRYSIPSLLSALGVVEYTKHTKVYSPAYLALKIIAYLNNILSFVKPIFLDCSLNITVFILWLIMIFLTVQYTVHYSILVYGSKGKVSWIFLLPAVPRAIFLTSKWWFAIVGCAQFWFAVQGFGWLQRHWLAVRYFDCMAANAFGWLYNVFGKRLFTLVGR